MVRHLGAREWMLVGLAALPLAAQAEKMSFQKEFPVAPGGTLSIRSDSGAIQIIGTSANEVSIAADIEGGAREVKGFHIAATQKGNDVEVSGRADQSGFWRWGSRRLDVTYTVRVPNVYDLKINTAGGEISIRDVKGRIDAGTSGGDIELRSIAGFTVVNTSGGDITAEALAGDLNARTSGGNIELSAVTGSAEVRTSGGNIHITGVAGKVQAKTSGGNVLVTVTGENQGIFAETSGGNIEIRVDKDVRADLEATTRGGSVRVDLPVTLDGFVDEDEVRGRLNGGGPLVHARTSGGSIRINAAQ